jgi:exo-1,4-beta-D-glucosaminidase
VEAKVYGFDGKLLDDRTAHSISVAAQGVARDALHPTVPATTTPPTPARTYFVELLLSQRGPVVDRNVYWLSTQQDLVDWAKTMGQPQATMTQGKRASRRREIDHARTRSGPVLCWGWVARPDTAGVGGMDGSARRGILLRSVRGVQAGSV